MEWFGVVDRVTYRGLVISADQTLDDPETRFQCGEVTTLESRDPIVQMTKCNLGTPGFLVGFPPPPLRGQDPWCIQLEGLLHRPTLPLGKKDWRGQRPRFLFLAVHFVEMVRHCKSIVNRLTAKPNGRMVTSIASNKRRATLCLQPARQTF